MLACPSHSLNHIMSAVKQWNLNVFAHDLIINGSPVSQSYSFHLSMQLWSHLSVLISYDGLKATLETSMLPRIKMKRTLGRLHSNRKCQIYFLPPHPPRISKTKKCWKALLFSITIKAVFNPFEKTNINTFVPWLDKYTALPWTWHGFVEMFLSVSLALTLLSLWGSWRSLSHTTLTLTSRSITRG